MLPTGIGITSHPHKRRIPGITLIPLPKPQHLWEPVCMGVIQALGEIQGGGGRGNYKEHWACVLTAARQKSLWGIFHFSNALSQGK